MAGKLGIIRWMSDFSNKFVISANFQRRGWQEVESEAEADIYWASTNSVKDLFAAESLAQLRPQQLINHFPNHHELTRKDLLAKNIKRYQRLASKSGVSLPTIIPSTFVLPQEYALFVESFRKQGDVTYILKPTSKAQGKGIFLINKLSQLKQKAEAIDAEAAAGRSILPVFGRTAGQATSRSGSGSGMSSSSAPLRPALEDHIISQYIDDPLLLGGKKFDLRLYVLVISYRPLIVYMSTLGFARCCSVNYSKELAELDNMLVHLTNLAVQKGGDPADYGGAHDNKWLLENLRLHLEATHGHAATAKLFTDMQLLVVHTLKAVQQIMIQDKHCFELYGFDILVDQQLTPWLMEVNASPSLTTTSQTDRLLKFKVINDTLSIVTLPWDGQGVSTRCEGAVASGSQVPAVDVGKAVRYPPALGSMQLIYDENLPLESSDRSHDPHHSKAPGDSATAASGGLSSNFVPSWQTPDGKGVQPSNYVILHG